MSSSFDVVVEFVGAKMDDFHGFPWVFRDINIIHYNYQDINDLELCQKVYRCRYKGITIK